MSLQAAISATLPGRQAFFRFAAAGKRRVRIADCALNPPPVTL